RSPGARPANARGLQAVGPGPVRSFPHVTVAPTIRRLCLLPEARRALETRELAVILRCYRKPTGSSQSAMGELLGYDPSYVSPLERRPHRRNPWVKSPHRQIVPGHRSLGTVAAGCIRTQGCSRRARRSIRSHVDVLRCPWRSLTATESVFEW